MVSVENARKGSIGLVSEKSGHARSVLGALATQGVVLPFRAFVSVASSLPLLLRGVSWRRSCSSAARNSDALRERPQTRIAQINKRCRQTRATQHQRRETTATQLHPATSQLLQPQTRQDATHDATTSDCAPDDRMWREGQCGATNRQCGHRHRNTPQRSRPSPKSSGRDATARRTMHSEATWNEKKKKKKKGSPCASSRAAVRIGSANEPRSDRCDHDTQATRCSETVRLEVDRRARAHTTAQRRHASSAGHQNRVCSRSLRQTNEASRGTRWSERTSCCRSPLRRSLVDLCLESRKQQRDDEGERRQTSAQSLKQRMLTSLLSLVLLLQTASLAHVCLRAMPVVRACSRWRYGEHATHAQRAG